MEEKTITLSQIGLYNPQRLSDDVVEKLFVVRTKLFSFLIEKLNKEKPNSIPQHYLIIAQRGMGKTTLLKRIEVELRKNQPTFVPLLFPEEQYNLKSLSEFWLNSLDALADTLEFEKKTQEVKQIDAKVKELGKIKNDEDLTKEAYQFLKSFTQSINRRPVMLIDNMSFIFDRLTKEEQHTLRAWLMQNSAPILIGASAVAIEDTYDYGAAFYDAFQTHYLKKLSFEELIEILTNLAKLTQSEELIPIIHQQIARIKTLYQLTGGNPRTASMLFKLIVKGFSEEINDDLEALLDEITPLYKARFEELPTQMQVIVDAIALHWDPINLEQLRNESRYENNQLSPQLKRLNELGWIEKIDAYQAKGNAYQISERFFNIWFLMRRSSRRQKRELYCLSKFLETLYGEDVQSIAQNRLLSKSSNIDHITYSLALAEVVKDGELRNQLQQKSYKELREFGKTNPEILKQFDLPKEETKPVFTFLDEKEHYLEVEKKLLSLVQLTKDNKKVNAQVYNDIGILYVTKMKRFEEAEKAFLNAIEINKKYTDAYNNLGNLYREQFQNFHKAEKNYLKAIEIDSKNVIAWCSLGDLYREGLQKYDDSEKAYKKAIQFDENFVYSWNGLGILYTDIMKKYDKAEKAFQKAVELDKKFLLSLYNLGNLYQNHLQKYEEAEKLYQKAIEIDKNAPFVWHSLGHLYQSSFEKYEEAEKAYLKAIEIDKKYANSWNGLGSLYQDHFQKYEEAEKAYLKAIELNGALLYPQYNLVFLYRDKMNKMAEAENLFNSLKVDTELEDSYWLNKTIFELYKRNEGIAKEYLEKALAKIENKLPTNTQDDWFRFGAIVSKLNYINWLLPIMEDKGFDVILAPYFVALKAMNEKDSEGYLNSKAVEIKEPAKKLIEILKKY